MRRIIVVLRDISGCFLGIPVYFIAKLASATINWRIKPLILNERTIEVMRPLLPGLDLDRIRFRERSILPGNLFRKKPRFSATTYGYSIYFRGSGMQGTEEKLNQVMHELVHSYQVSRRNNSELRFACDYGKGFLKGGSYRKNPLEEEAFRFVEEHRLNNPDFV